MADNRNLRKEIRKKLISSYNKRKDVFDIKNIEKTFRIKRQYIFLLFFLLFIFLFDRKFLLFVLLTILSAAFSFYHSKLNRTPMDFKLALFFGLFITRYYGILFTILFFILSDTLPSLLGGESLRAASFIFIGWYFIVNAIVYLFPFLPLVILGPILVIVEAIGSFFINSRFGIPGIMSFFVSIFTIMIRIIYFLTLGGLLEALFKSMVV